MGQMVTIGKRISGLLEKYNMTQRELANKVNVTEVTIGRYINDVREPKGSILKDIASALGVTTDYILGADEVLGSSLVIKNIEDILEITTQKIPLLGDIACGTPNLAEEYFQGYVDVGTDVRADFALRCNGDSMINARILDGDIVFIKKQEMVNNGEIAAVLLEDEATLKRVYMSDTTITLMAANDAYPPRVIDLREDSDLVFKILGKAVAFQSDVR